MHRYFSNIHALRPLAAALIALAMPWQGQALTNHSGTISSDETWSGAGEVHLLTSNVTVASGVTLTIEPGAIIKSQSRYSLVVAGGRLLAQGTGVDPIYFTSYHDDTLGGDTNGDGNASSPNRGDWYRVELQNAEGSRLSNVEMRYGGYSSYGELRLYFSTYTTDPPQVVDCTFSESSTYGIYIDGSSATEPTLSGNAIDNTSSWAIYSSSGSLQTTFFNNSIDQCAHGIYTTGPAVIDSNAVANTSGYAIQSTGANSILRDNTISAGANYGIYASGATTSVTGNSVDAATSYAAYLTGAGTTCSGNTLDGGSSAGIYVGGADMIITNNTVTGTTGPAVSMGNGVGPIATFANNDLSGNGPYPARLHADNIGDIASNDFSGWVNQLAYEVLGGTINSDATWSDLGVPYVLRYSSVSVADATTLTIAPGVVFKFDTRSYFYVYGTLLANGLNSNKIVFTSYRDDTAGGDTNGDGDGSAPAKGDWYHVYFYDAEASRLDYTELRYGGYNSYGIVNIYHSAATTSPVTVQNCSIDHSNSYGIYLQGSGAIQSPIITGNSISDCSSWAIYNSTSNLTAQIDHNTIDANYGIYSASPGPITDNTLTNIVNYGIQTAASNTVVRNNAISGTPAYGIYVSAATDTIDSNSIAGATTAAIYINGAGAVVTDNSVLDASAQAIYMVNGVAPMSAFSGNTFGGDAPFPVRIHVDNVRNLSANSFTSWQGTRGYEILGGSLTTDATWADLGVPYVLRYSSLTIPDGIALTLSPGVVFKFDTRSYVYVYGQLNSAGTSGDHVVITAYRDDTAGGDTNGDGNATTPSPGTWYSVYFSDAENSRLSYTDLRYGGYSAYGMVRVYQTVNQSSPVRIENCGLTFSSTNAIYLSGSGPALSPTIAYNTISDCGTGHWAIDNESASVTAAISHNTISANYGIYSAATGPITDNTITGVGQKGIQASAANLVVRNNSVSGTPVYGIYINAAADTVESNTISGATAGAIYVAGAGATIRNNTITAATGRGLYMGNGVAPMAAFSGNTFAGDYDFPARLHAENVRDLSANTFSSWSNALGYEVLGGSLETNATWPDPGIPYVLRYSNLTVPDGISLTLDPGVIFKFDTRSYFYVYGQLLSEGTTDNHITFSAFRDDSAGGDTNNNGSGNSPAPGDWYSIYFYDAENSHLLYTDLRYGGYSAYGMVRVYQTVNQPSPVRIEHCNFTNSSTNAIYLSGSGPALSPTIAYNTISDCGTGHWAIDNASASVTSNISHNTIDANYGIYSAAAGPITDNTITGVAQKGIQANAANLVVRNNSVSGTPVYGIYVNAAADTIESNAISGATTGAIYIAGADATIRNNTITSATGRGLYMANGVAPMAAFSGNTFAGDYDFPARVHAENVRDISGNTFTSWQNALGYEVLGGSLETSATWPNFGIPYVLRYSNVTIPDGVSLTLSPGLVFKFDTRSYLYVYGQLLSEGTTDDHIVFTAFRDDSAGGDTNNDGTATSPAKGDWYSIYFSDAENSHLLYTDLRYGGYSAYGMVRVYQTVTQDNPVRIEHCSLTNSSTNAIYLSGSGPVLSPLIANNSISDCGTGHWAIDNASASVTSIISHNAIDANYGIHSSAAGPITDNTISNVGTQGIQIAAANAVVRNNTISGTPSYGIYVNAAADTIDANSVTGATTGAIYVAAADVSVTDNSIADCTGRAIYMGNGTAPMAAFSGNTMTGDYAYPVRIHVDNLRNLADNTWSGWTDPAAIEVLGGSLTTNAVWPDFGLPLVLRYSNVTVPDGIGLQLPAGLVFKFDSRATFYVYGQLISEGTGTDPIYFTSFRDDTVGGDSNLDGNATSPARSDWYNLYFSNAEDSRLVHTNLRWGGYGGYGLVRVYHSEDTASPAVVRNCEISESYSHGIYVEGSGPTLTPDISYNHIHDCSSWAIYHAAANLQTTIDHNTCDGNYGIYTGGPTPVTNNTLLNIANTGLQLSHSGAQASANTISGPATYGIYVTASDVAVASNTVTGAAGYGLYASATLGACSANSFSGTGSYPIYCNAADLHRLTANTFDWPTALAYKVTGGSVSGNVTWSPFDQPYLILGNITVGAGDTLNIDAGTILKMNARYSLTVNGQLNSNGSAARPVVITSIKDDTWGGDTNANGNATSPAKGDWYYVSAPNADADVNLRYTNLYYGGYSSGYEFYSYNNSVSIEDCDISHSQSYNLYLQDCTGSVQRTTLAGSSYGAYCTGTTDVTFTDCNITGNSSYGIYKNTSPSVDARNCWWGDASGPYHASANPSGNGDTVSDNVLFNPWLNAEFAEEALTVELLAYQSLIPKGGTFDFKETLANTYGDAKTFNHRFRVYDEAGQLYYEFPPQTITLASGESRATLYTMRVPPTVPVGVYTLEAKAYDGPTIFDADSLSAQVIDLAQSRSGLVAGAALLNDRAGASGSAPGGGDLDADRAPQGAPTGDDALRAGQGQRPAATPARSRSSSTSASGTRRIGATTRGSAGSAQAPGAGTQGDDLRGIQSSRTVTAAPPVVHWTLEVVQVETTHRDAGGVYTRVQSATSAPLVGEPMSEAAQRAADAAIRELGQDLLDEDPATLNSETPAAEFSFGLAPAAPNPFNPLTTLSFTLEETAPTQLVIYDLSGHVVIRLVDESLPAGHHSVQWNGRNQQGQSVASGVYLAVLVTPDERATRRLMLVK